MALTAEPFRTSRLIFRAPDPEATLDQTFFLKLAQEPLSNQKISSRLAKPQDAKGSKEYLKYVAEEALLGVVICLPAISATYDPTPIGVIHLTRLPPDLVQHRHTDIGIGILEAYQGQGYGIEAVRWVVQWAFLSAGLHRVNINAFRWNEGAVRLYEKLGFQPEGVIREKFFMLGKWVDEVQLGMLESDWKAMQESGSN